MRAGWSPSIFPAVILSTFGLFRGQGWLLSICQLNIYCQHTLYDGPCDRATAGDPLPISPARAHEHLQGKAEGQHLPKRLPFPPFGSLKLRPRGKAALLGTGHSGT